jgi:hypothetical protein
MQQFPLQTLFAGHFAPQAPQLLLSMACSQPLSQLLSQLSHTPQQRFLQAPFSQVAIR